ncbi:N-glycosylase/DNA lyase (OGG1) [Vairimorpha necatrix]|uniref:DNA-(apurinic or apyrimidinic site) lyase n=1 Tax=Vairimorpha necatrix TaxID=6039 RepID=A0AAX4JDE2_9MICR
MENIKNGGNFNEKESFIVKDDIKETKKISLISHDEKENIEKNNKFGKNYDKNYTCDDKNISDDKNEWRNLKTDEIINLQDTLFSGQVFNFHKTDDDEFTGAIYFFIVTFKEKNGKIFYKILHTKIENFYLIEMYLNRFFTLQINYSKIFTNQYTLGLRLLNNALIPTIFSFICSANNNVTRIQKMVNFLYSKGEFICKYKNIDLYYFPELSKLLNIKNDLVEIGFGYRSSYIGKTAETLINAKEFSIIKTFDDKILENYTQNGTTIKNLDYKKIENLLLKLSGVGPKVKDCILLMGIGMFKIVPIDTHIFKHAKKLFNFECKILTSKNYKEIQEKFVDLFGEYAGIYQLFIFKDYLKKIN